MPEDWEKYAVTSDEKDGDDWSQFEVKKNQSPAGSTNGGLTLKSGSDLFQDPVNTKQPSVLTQKGLQSYKPTKYVKPSVKPKNLPEAVDDDNNYLGSIWNQIVNSGSDLVGGMTRLIAKSNPYLNPVLAATSDQLGDKASSTAEKLRTNSSSKEYEERLLSGFDLSNGISMDEAKAMPLLISRFAADAGLSIPTGGASFLAQSYNSGLKEYDKATAGQPVDQNTRELFGVGYGIINGAADMASLDFITKNPLVTKGIKKAILSKGVQELSKIEGKITSDIVEQTFKNVAKQSFNKIKHAGVKALASGAVEGGTESIQGGLSDGLKILTNKLSDKEVFNKEEITEDFLKNRLNDFAGGAVLGSMLGGAIALKSSKEVVAKQVAEATSPEALDFIKTEIASEVDLGTIDPDRGEVLINAVDKYAAAANKLPADISIKQRKTAIENIVQRDEVSDLIKKKEELAASSDESLAPQTKIELDLLEAKRQSLNDNIVEATTDEKFKYSVDPESGKYYKQLGEDAEPEEITKQQYDLEKQVAPKNDVPDVPLVEDTSQQNNTPELTDNNLESKPLELKDGENNSGITITDTAAEGNQGEGTANQEANSSGVSEIGTEAVNENTNKDSEVVLRKAETDLAALKQVENKTGKYEASVKRLTEAKQHGLITDTEFNETLKKFDDVIAEYTPKGIKTSNVEEIAPDQVLEPEIEGEVKTPSEEKLAEIRARRAEIKKRLTSRVGQLSSGFNPDVVTDLIELGTTYIQEGVIRFSDFAAKLRSDHGEDIPDSIIRDVYEKSAEANGLGIRKFTESIEKSDLSDEVKSAVENSDYRTYNKQKLDELENKVDDLPEMDRVAAVAGLSSRTDGLDSDNNFAVLAGISLINEYSAAGKIEEANKIAEMLSRSSTVIAQTLRQFGQLKKSSAVAFVTFIEKQLGEKGKKLSAEQKARVTELFEAQKALFQQMEAAQDIHVEQITDQSRKDYYTAVGAYEIATHELENYLESLLPRDLASTLATILKGNLLTLKSLIANPLYNIFYAPIRFSKGEISNLIDKSISKVAGTPRTKISSMSADAMSIAAQSIATGSKVAYKKMMQGGSGGDLLKYDIDRRLKPAKAWERFWSKDDEFTQRKMSEKMSDFMESTFGWTANAAFRLLPFGDDPVFEMAKNHRLLEIAKTKGYKGDDIERFMIKPDEASLKSATQYGKSATFQDNNILSSGAVAALKSLEDYFTAIHPFAGGSIKLLGAASFPFIKTPASVAIKIVNYAAPVIPSIRAVVESGKAIKATKAYKLNPTEFNKERVAKHQRLLAEASADVAISIALTSIASIVVANGLITGSAPEEKERKSEKDFMYATQPPFTLNISGLARLMSGGDPAYQTDDTAITYNVLGVLGAILGIVNDTRGSELREQAKNAKKKGLGGKPYFPESDDNDWVKWGKGLFFDAAATLPASVKYLTEQSFLQGIESVMGAVSKGDYAQWETQLFRTLLSIPVPNTFVQLNKTWRENMRDPYTDDQLETMGNIIEERMRVGDGGDLPVRIDIWGQKVNQTPEGANPFVYQTLDPFKTQSIMHDATTLKVFDIFRKTQDAGAIPPAVNREIVISGEKRRLTKEQYQQLLELVGQERKKAVDIILKDYNPKSVDKLEYQIERLKTAYQYGAKIGKGKFLDKNRNLLR